MKFLLHLFFYCIRMNKKFYEVNYMIFSKAALHVAVEKENIEAVLCLLCCKDIDVNIFYIFKYFFNKIKNRI